MNNNENKTNNDNFGRGITLIVIGVIALLITFFDIEIDWHVVGKMWPMILIIIGVCLMPINRWIRTALALLLLIIGYAAYQQKADVTKAINRTEIISTFSDDDDDY